MIQCEEHIFSKMGGSMTKWEGGNWGSCERNAMSKWNKAVVDIGFADERVKLHAIFALGGLILFQNSYHEGHFGLTQMVDLALLGCAGLGSNTGIFMIHASSRDESYLKKNFHSRDIILPRIEVNEVNLFGPENGSFALGAVLAGDSVPKDFVAKGVDQKVAEDVDPESAKKAEAVETGTKEESSEIEKLGYLDVLLVLRINGLIITPLK